MLTRVAAPILAACLLAGCNSEITKGEEGTVIVYGRVSAADHSVPPRMLMSMAAHAEASCESPLFEAVNAFTDESGEYRGALYIRGSERSVCVSVRAQPPEESGFLPSSVQRTPVLMRPGVTDSIRVDVVLQRGN